MSTFPRASSDEDSFLNRAIGKLTILSKVKRGKRWAWVCRCACGAVTAPMRQAYIIRRGALAACYDCSHAIPRSGLPVRSGALLRGEREQPTNQEPEDDRHEQAGDPIWRVRSRLLAEAILRPMPSAAVIVLAKARFGWSDEITREVLAAADGAELVKCNGLWQRNAARTMTSLVSSRSTK